MVQANSVTISARVFVAIFPVFRRWPFDIRAPVSRRVFLRVACPLVQRRRIMRSDGASPNPARPRLGLRWRSAAKPPLSITRNLTPGPIHRLSPILPLSPSAPFAVHLPSRKPARHSRFPKILRALCVSSSRELCVTSLTSPFHSFPRSFLAPPAPFCFNHLEPAVCGSRVSE